MSVNSKKKGNLWENRWANWLKNNGITSNARRNRGSGGGLYKSDVHNDLGISFEVKAGKAISLQKAFTQSQRDAEKSRTTPYVVIHYDGMPEDTFYVVMTNWDWADLIKKAQEPKTTQYAFNRQDKYTIQHAIKSLKDVLKLLE